MSFLIDHVRQLQSSLLASSGLNPVCPSLLFIGDPQTGRAIPDAFSQVTNTEGGSTLWICCLQILLIQYPGCCWFSQPQGHIAGPCCPPRPPGPFQKSCLQVIRPSVCIAALVCSVPGARLCICFGWTLWSSCQPIFPGCQSPSEQQCLLPPAKCHLHTCGECSLSHQPGHQWRDQTLLSPFCFLRDTSSQWPSYNWLCATDHNLLSPLLQPIFHAPYHPFF